jgi:peptidyl-tRNA hydrolase, PTH1 family
MVIYGLGNPGEKYLKTRHNIGFNVVDEFQKKNGFPEFKLSKKFNSELSEGILGTEKIILAKPQTFMNESGTVLKKIINNYKSPINNLIVIHDDIDLPLGKTKISKDSGSGGHKGVESIIKNLKTKEFIRFRVGIQPKRGKPERAENFVLRNFTNTEEKIIKETIEKTVLAIEVFIKDGLEKAMNEFNK